MSLKYFSLSEFACKCGCGQNLIDYGFVEKHDILRHKYGKPIVISSGYRCPDHTARVSKTGRTGPHTTGHASDSRVDRGDAYRLLKIAPDLGFTGIGIQKKGGARFIHLDDLPNTVGTPRPTIWIY